MSDDFTRDSDKRFTLRIDKKLFEIVKQSAHDNKRSIGKQIEFILDQHFHDKTHKDKNHKA